MKKVLLAGFFFNLFYLLQAQTNGELSVSVTTSSAGGNFAPKHITAIWVETESGTFVKTLLAYANKRITYLNNWETSTTNAGSTYNRVDAITGATQTVHGVKTCKWNGTDVNGNLVADGTYVLRMELTDKNATGNCSSFTFTKSADQISLTPANVPSFSSISINWTSTNSTGISDGISSEVTIYPNPSQGIINIAATEMDYAEVVNILGDIVYKSTNTTIDLSEQPNGFYFVLVHLSSGKEIVKKISKK